MAKRGAVRLWLGLLCLLAVGCDGDLTPTEEVPALTPNSSQIAQTITALAYLLTPGAQLPTPPISPFLTTPTPPQPAYSSYSLWWQRHGGVAIAQPGFTPLPNLAPYVAQTPPNVPNLPAPPQKLEEYPAVLAGYLAKLPDGKPDNPKGAAARLKEALQGWKAMGAEGVVGTLDLDRDGNADLVATAWKGDPAAKTLPSSTANLPGIVFVLRANGGGWTPAVYRKGLTPNAANRDWSAPLLYQVGQVSKAGQVAIAFTETACGTQNCIETVHVAAPLVTGTFRDLAPDPPTMAYPTLSFADRDGNGDLALVVRGNVWPAANAGLQRERTDIYRWDVRDLVYKLSETLSAGSAYLYYKVQDGNIALSQRNYSLAIQLYTQALSDDSLKLWQAETSGASAGQTELGVLRAFARFRLALTYAVMGDNKAAMATLNEASRLDGEYAGWSRAFMGAYNSVGGLPDARYSFDPAYLFPTIVVPGSPSATPVPPTATPAPPTSTATPLPTTARVAPKTPARTAQTSPLPPTPMPTSPAITGQADNTAVPPTATPTIVVPNMATTPGLTAGASGDGTGIGVARPLTLSPVLKNACVAAIRYSSDHPDLIARLNQYGASNPFFRAQDICPPYA